MHLLSKKHECASPPPVLSLLSTSTGFYGVLKVYLDQDRKYKEYFVQQYTVLQYFTQCIWRNNGHLSQKFASYSHYFHNQDTHFGSPLNPGVNTLSSQSGDNNCHLALCLTNYFPDYSNSTPASDGSVCTTKQLLWLHLKRCFPLFSR